MYSVNNIIMMPMLTIIPAVRIVPSVPAATPSDFLSTEPMMALVFGEAKMRYDINDRDFANLIRGVALTSEILFASGARRVLLPFDFLPALESPDQIKTLFAHPIPKDEVECLTVHAMGTCKMGVDKRSSVVDAHGESWDVPGLFVADASVFPGPIGVNPQITIMALATRIARSIAADLGQAVGVAGTAHGRAAAPHAS